MSPRIIKLVAKPRIVKTGKAWNCISSGAGNCGLLASWRTPVLVSGSGDTPAAAYNEWAFNAALYARPPTGKVAEAPITHK